MKRKIIFIISLLMLLVPLKALGLTQSVSISCDKNEIQQGESVNCILKGSTDGFISGIDAMLSSDQSLEISNKSVCEGKGWINFGEKIDSHIELITEEDINNTFDIISFNISSSIPGNYKIYLKDISFIGGVEEDFAEHALSDYELPITVKEKQQEIKQEIQQEKNDDIDTKEEKDNLPEGQVISDVPNTKKNAKLFANVGYVLILGVISILTLHFIKIKKRRKEL